MRLFSRQKQHLRLFGASSDDKSEKPVSPPSLSARAAVLLPGVSAAASVATVGYVGADKLGMALLAAQGLSGSSPISAIPVSIILGMGISNTVGTSDELKQGLSFCSTTMLRAGIVSVGLKLSLLDVAALGATGIPVVVASMGTGLMVIPFVARHMGLSKKMGSLLAAGTSVCGVTAITAAAPAINANSKDTAVAIANVVAYGTLGMLCYPYMAHALLPGPQQAGMFLGVAVHDTSQVLGSAMTYNQVFNEESVLKVAAVTKLTRNLFLAAVIPGLAWQYNQPENQRDDGAVNATKCATPSGSTSISGLATFQKYVPGFVLAFIGAAGFRSTGDFLLQDGASLGGVDVVAFDGACNAMAATGSTVGLGTAMAAVGLATSASALKGVGPRPFVVGGIGAFAVGGTGFAMIQALGHASEFAA
jgi:uncharacterized integral membrane protein (TIGR00698 family)